MSQNGSRLAIIGPIIGFILVYFILRAAVGQFHADQDSLKDFGVATVQEIQVAGAEDIQEGETDEAAAEETNTEEDVAAETDAAAEETSAEADVATETDAAAEETGVEADATNTDEAPEEAPAAQD